MVEAVLPPVISVGAKFIGRVLGSQRMARIEVTCLCMTTQTEANRILYRIGTSVGLLNDVMYVYAAPSKLVTHAASAMRLHQNFIADAVTKRHDSLNDCGLTARAEPPRSLVKHAPSVPARVRRRAQRKSSCRVVPPR